MKNKVTFKKYKFFLAAVIPIALCSCTKKAELRKNTPLIAENNSNHIIMGFSQIGSESAWRTRNTQSVLEAAEAAGIQVIYENAQQKQANQLKAIRNFIVYQVDVIAFVPIVENGWENVLMEAQDAHIPVIVVDRKINAPKNLYAGFIGENNYEEGRKAGEFLLEKFKLSPQTKYQTYNILELFGTSNSSPALERARGFREVIGQDSRFKIIRSEDGDFLRSRGKEIIDNILKGSPSFYIDDRPVNIIFSHNDAMTLGALDAFESHYFNNLDQITIVSVDGEQKSIDALKEGKLNCVIECNPNLGPELIQLVKTLANRNTIPEETYMQGTMFTENDNLENIADRGY